MYGTQLQAYKSVHKSTPSSGRELEASVLSGAALKLTLCQKLWGQEGHVQRLDEALRVNQQIWTIFQSEMTREDNPLAENIKRNILSLSLFIDRRIFEVMANPMPEKLDIIININLNLAAGLRGSKG